MKLVILLLVSSLAMVDALGAGRPGNAHAHGSPACQVSEWSDWKDEAISACGSGMHMSSQIRYRTLIGPGDGSAACPALSERREVHVMCESAAVKIQVPPRGTAVYATLRVQDTAETVNEDPTRFGDFRVPCAYSHMAYDDPIVFAGSPGASHLHVFFGNTSTDANSTLQSLDAGSSTCRGGTANRSAYWVPAIIDAGLNQAVVPSETVTYYKDAGMLPPLSPIFGPPKGLRMIAGNPVTWDKEITWETTPDLNHWYHRFECWSDKLPGGRSGKMQRIPADCPVGGHILFELYFPNCWDGKNLDSPNHRSHMAYSFYPKPCPKTHPVRIAQISFNIHVPVQEGNDTSKWRLSSDAYDTSKPGGYSAHGDVWVDWDEDVEKAWMDGCIRVGADCHAHMIGDNKMLY